jgi:WD40 repeat protein
MLASGSQDRTAKLWDVATGKDLATLGGYVEGVRCVAFSPDGKTLAAGAVGSELKLWEVATGKERADLKGHGAGVLSVAFHTGGRLLASGYGDETVNLWDLAAGKGGATLTKTGPLVAFSPDGKTLGCGGDHLKLWDVATGKERATLKGHTNIQSLQFTAGGKALFSEGISGTIKLWEIAPER